MKNVAWFSILTWLAFLPSWACSHEFWLSPSDFQARAGRAVSIGALAGNGFFEGEHKPWSTEHAVCFLARTSRVFDLKVAAGVGDYVWSRFLASDDGGAMVAFESSFTPIELPGPKFNRYLEEEGLSGPRSARQTLPSDLPGRERYRRCAKTWLGGTEVARALASFGLPLEIVPLGAPGADSSLDIRVLRQGRPLPGALVKAWCSPPDPEGLAVSGSTDGCAWEGRTDEAGRVRVPTRRAGAWLLSLVDMVPCADRTQADWESTWASLTFARP